MAAGWSTTKSGEFAHEKHACTLAHSSSIHFSVGPFPSSPILLLLSHSIPASTRSLKNLTLNAQRRRWTEAQAAIEAGEVVDASVFLTKTIKRTEHSAGFRTLLEGWMDASKLFFRGDNDEFDLILEETRKEEAKRLALIEKAENQILGKVLEEGERVDVWEKSKLGKKLFARLDVLKRREEAVDPLLAGLKGEIPHFSTNRYAVPDKVFASLFVFVSVCMYVCMWIRF